MVPLRPKVVYNCSGYRSWASREHGSMSSGLHDDDDGDDDDDNDSVSIENASRYQNDCLVFNHLFQFTQVPILLTVVYRYWQINCTSR
jgi:hypothetical protein